MLTAVLLASLVTTPIKVLGLIIIFAKESGLNRLLLWLGVVNEPVTILGNRVGVILGLIYYSLAFAVLLLYSVIRTIPVALEEAAAIPGLQSIAHVVARGPSSQPARPGRGRIDGLQPEHGRLRRRRTDGSRPR